VSAARKQVKVAARESGGDAIDVRWMDMYGEGCGTHCKTGTCCNYNERCTDLGGCRCLSGREGSSCELPSGESGSTAEA
jgi:hypothetical protein